MKRSMKNNDTKLILLIISIITDPNNLLFNDLVGVLPEETSGLLRTTNLSEDELKEKIANEREILKKQMNYLIEEILKNPKHPLYEKMVAIFTE